MTRIVLVSLIVTAAALSLGGPAHAASFDCRKAANPDEIAICDSRELSELDVKMATLYDTIVKFVGMGVRGAMQDQQRAWLQERAGRPRLHPQALRHTGCLVGQPLCLATVAAMTGCVRVCRSLSARMNSHDDVKRTLALIVLRHVDGGERDPERLADAAHRESAGADRAATETPPSLVPQSKEL